MIQFSLKCEHDHRFDSWFKSAEAFDKLLGCKMVLCPVCTSPSVEKAIMAPRVQSSRSKGIPVVEKPLSQPASPAEQALAQLKKQVEANSEYVGMNFAREAREIHEGIAPGRSIHGEAKPEEARKLIEDGIPVAPLPFTPGRKTN